MLFCICNVHAQNILALLDENKKNIDKGNYALALRSLDEINESLIVSGGDSCVILYNYEKGKCLYSLDRYEEAIPFLSKGLELIEKLPHENCISLELLYGIGYSYKKMKQYDDAEKYFRRVFIRGSTQNLKCVIKTQTLRELVEVYTQLGQSNLADACIVKIEASTNSTPSTNWKQQIDELYELAEGYEQQGQQDLFIDSYNKILKVVEENEGCLNEDYLLYSSILGMRLQYSYNRSQDALLIYERIIKIGESLNLKHAEVCNAYANYLQIKSELNDVNAVESILPKAIKYYNETIEKNRKEVNLYEIIGNNFCGAGNYKVGVKYLETDWKGEKANSIRSLTNLGDFYYKKQPQKAIDYFKRAESRIDETEGVTIETKRIIYVKLMYLFSKIGNFHEAVKYAKLSIPLVQAQCDVDYYTQHLINYAIYLCNIDKCNSVNNILSDIEGLITKIKPETLIAVYSNEGFIYLKCGKPTKAISPLNEGIRIAKKSLTNKDQWLSILYHNLGRAYMLSSNFSEALVYLNMSKNLQFKISGKITQRTQDYINECLQHKTK